MENANGFTDSVQHRHMAKAMVAHPGETLVEQVINTDIVYWAAHDLSDRDIGVDGETYPSGQILLGDNARR